MKKLLTALIAVTAVLGAASAQSAQNVDSVIIASTANYPDAMISAAPADKLGIPVLLTEKNSLSNSTANALERLNASRAYIVGGPRVVSEEVQQTISNHVNTTTRLWGMTQVGTSVQVSEYFWAEGTDEAVIVQYPQAGNAYWNSSYKLLAAVRNEVQDEDEPILISKEGTLSASVLSQVNDLNATEVEVYSTDAVNVTQDLEAIGVENVEVEEIPSGTDREQIQRLADRIQNRTLSTNRNISTLVIVAAANFRHAISVPVVPNSASMVIGSEEQISEAVARVESSSADTIKVTGKPRFARQIANRIQAETNRTVDRISGPPEESAAESALDNRKEWADRNSRAGPEWRQDLQKMNRGLRKAANRTINIAESGINASSSEKARELLVDAQKAYSEGDYFEAKKLAIRANSMERTRNFGKLAPEEIAERARSERADMAESAEEARGMAEGLREAESVEERLKIIEEYRKEKKKEARERRGPSESPGSVGETDLSIESKGLVIVSSMGYTAPNTGYTVESSTETTGSTVKFEYRVRSSEGATGQALTRLTDTHRVKLEEGTYNVSVDLYVDGELKAEKNSEMALPGFHEAEKEVEKEETERNRSTGPQETEEQESGTSQSGGPVERTDEAADMNVTLSNYRFSSDSIKISEGQVISFVNTEGRHTVTLESGKVDVTLSRGESMKLRFDEEGTYSIYCRFHGSPGSGMHTQVTVS
ncbi:MAG: cell wall-binding repeat-containing protein [Candidatus Nanohaloarchaea archaeon]